MSVVSGAIPTQADMDALADLANAVIGPLVAIPQNYWHPYLPDGYEFPYIDAAVLPPTAVVGVDGVSPGDYSEGELAIVRVYSYKEVSGRKHYSQAFATASFLIPAGGSGSIDWSWTAPSGGADGYIITTGSPGAAIEPGGVYALNGYLFGLWQQVAGATNLADDRTTWLQPDDQIRGAAVEFNPVAAGSWLRMLNFIREDLFDLSLVGAAWNDADLLVSGPWCCAVGPRLRNALNSLASHKDIEFYFAADDHSGDLDVSTEAEIGSSEEPVDISESAFSSNYSESLTFSCPAAGNWVGQIRLEQAGFGTGWSGYSLTVSSGSVTINTASFTIEGDELVLDFDVDLPSGASSLLLVATRDGGSSFHVITASLVSSVLLDLSSYTPSDADVIHLSSLGKKVALPDIDQALGPVVFRGANRYLSLYADGVEGVWVAKVLPVFAVHTFLEGALPNYRNGETGSISGPRDPSPFAAIGGLNPTEPAVPARSSLWPVFRDTDFAQWVTRFGGEFYAPFYNNGSFSQETRLLSPNTPDYPFGGLPFPSLPVFAKIESSVIGIKFYFSEIDYPDPTNPATYEYTATTSARFPDDIPFPAGGTYYMALVNEGSVAVSSAIKFSTFRDYESYHPEAKPILFEAETETGRGAVELYSYNFPQTKETVLQYYSTEIPKSGYCISRVTVQRKPQGEPAAVPTTGSAELEVKIGVMLGTWGDDPGSFSEFATLTIPADQGSISQDVFWPVLEGACLAYQASAEVQVFAQVNFQPAVISRFLQTSDEYPFRYGRHSGNAVRQPNCVRFLNLAYNGREDYITMPISATIYNDLEAALSI